MKNQVQFVVTVTFADKVSGKKNVMEVTQNILNGLVDKVNHGETGIAPVTQEDDETSNYTTKIAVRPLEVNFGMYEKKTELEHNF